MPSSSLLKFAFYFVKKQWKWFLAIQLFSFAWAIDHTVWPYILMIFVDEISTFTGDRSLIWTALSEPIWMGLTLWIFVEFGYRLQGILMAWTLPNLEASVRQKMFSYTQHHSPSYFADHFAGSISNKISDMTHHLTQVTQLIMTLFIPVFVALMISIFLFAKVNLFFAFALITWFIIHIGICLGFGKKCGNFANIHSESRTTLTGKIVDSLTNNMNVKLFSRFRYEEQHIGLYQYDEKMKQWQSLWFIEKMKILLGIVGFVGVCIVLNGLMIKFWQYDLITTGEVVFIFNTCWNITIMAWLAGLQMPILFQSMGVCKQALTIIQDPHEIKDEPDALPLKITKGRIVFDKVTFHYEPKKCIFENKSLVIEPGERIGLVGFSGAGKTTFVNLILRFFKVEKGKILIDGQDISKVTQESIREQISVIPQDTILFHRSILENIRYAKLDASDKEVKEAAKAAFAEDFIEKLPEKYETFVGERGVKLSGGERQRIAIARAILKNSPILILDEATSSLDSITEKEIQESLSFLMKGKTTIAIAHRLSTIASMDRILVFKKGKIIEEGTHHSLISAKGHYALMWSMQAKGFIPSVDPS